MIQTERTCGATVRRRVGRPRKDPSAPKKESPSILTEERTKRIRKRPLRYSYGEEDDANVSGKENVKVRDESTNFVAKKKREEIPNSFPHELTSVTDLLDLNKLDVLMDGDEECVQQETDPEGVIPMNSISTEEGATTTMDPSRNDVMDGDDDSDYEEELRRKKLKPKRKRGRGRPKKGGSKKVASGERYKYKCPFSLCNNTYTSRNSLKYHIESKHSENVRANCPACDRGFKHARSLKEHLATHSNEREFKCDVCDKGFKTASTLHTHMKSHKPPEYECDAVGCGQLFTLASSLKAHILLHEGLKPHQCVTCLKTFTQQSNLRVHERIHVDDRPYKCESDGCDKAFKTSTQRKEHARIHDEPRPCLCHICAKRFASETTLRAHLSSHEGNRPYVCQICVKGFVTPNALRKHGRIHSRRPLDATRSAICPCGQEFPNKKLLFAHKRACPRAHQNDDQRVGDVEPCLISTTVVDMIPGVEDGPPPDYEDGYGIAENCVEEQVVTSSPQETEEEVEQELVPVDLANGFDGGLGGGEQYILFNVNFNGQLLPIRLPASSIVPAADGTSGYVLTFPEEQVILTQQRDTKIVSEEAEMVGGVLGDSEETEVIPTPSTLHSGGPPQ